MATKKPKPPRTFKLKKPRMRGSDVKSWQEDIKRIFKRQFNMNVPIKIDGTYGPSTRSYSASLVKAMGLSSKAMNEGVTPELRTKLRNNDLTLAERQAKSSQARKDYREKLRKQFKQDREPKVHKFTSVILQDSWDYHPGIHDGIDVITPADAVLFAPVKCRVIDVRPSGWWGLGAPTDPKKRARGDGIIQLRVLETVGPFKKGMHIGYGHAEKAMVKVGQTVKPGTPIGRAGLANAWHIHLMINDGSVGLKGVGNVNPRACLEFTKKWG